MRGYVFIHKPIERLHTYTEGLLDIAYLTLAILFLCAFMLLAIFAYTIIHPIKKITKAANEYASGNFEHPVDVHSNDEIGYLAASLSYMANELNTLEEDQRKFVSNVSHDFRSPLTSIKGYVEAMLDGTTVSYTHLFGIGHLVNLFNGQSFFETMIQILFAIAVGFTLVVLFYKGKSLIPCIIFHGLNNSLSVIEKTNREAAEFFSMSELQFEIIFVGIAIFLLVIYSICIMKNCNDEDAK